MKFFTSILTASFVLGVIAAPVAGEKRAIVEKRRRHNPVQTVIIIVQSAQTTIIEQQQTITVLVSATPAAPQTVTALETATTSVTAVTGTSTVTQPAAGPATPSAGGAVPTIVVTGTPAQNTAAVLANMAGISSTLSLAATNMTSAFIDSETSLNNTDISDFTSLIGASMQLVVSVANTMTLASAFTSPNGKRDESHEMERIKRDLAGTFKTLTAFVQPMFGYAINVTSADGGIAALGVSELQGAVAAGQSLLKSITG